MNWKPEPVPNELYKYRSLADARQRDLLKDILLNNRLYWPSPSQFNDPFDCLPIASLAGSKTDLRKYRNRLVKKHMADAARFQRRATKRRMLAEDIPNFQANLQKVMDGRLTEIGVCSFSESCDNVLMWSHYANSHGGVCLRFRPTRADEEFLHASRVAYSPARPVINVIKSTTLEWAEKSLFTKADYWKYEKEWRAFDIHEVGLHPFRRGLLDGIILGARISNEDRAQVLSWVEARNSPTEVLAASFDPKKFRLVISAT